MPFLVICVFLFLKLRKGILCHGNWRLGNQVLMIPNFGNRSWVQFSRHDISWPTSVYEKWKYHNVNERKLVYARKTWKSGVNSHQRELLTRASQHELKISSSLPDSMSSSLSHTWSSNKCYMGACRSMWVKYQSRKHQYHHPCKSCVLQYLNWDKIQVLQSICPV